MTDAQIKTAIREAIQEFTQSNVMNSTLTSLITRAITELWNKIKVVSPGFATRRISLSSNTSVFELSDDCLSVRQVWDMRTNAGGVTGATNATPIVVTLASHGFSSDDILLLHDIGGTLAANGTKKITVVDTNSFSLNGSVGNGAYTSGGKAFKENAAFTRIERTTIDAARQKNRQQWYLRGRNIVVDFTSFSNDIVVDYLTGATPALSDIPAEFHEAIISFAVVNIADSDATGKAGILFHSRIWEGTLLQIQDSFRLTSSPNELPKGIEWDTMI